MFLRAVLLYCVCTFVKSSRGSYHILRSFARRRSSTTAQSSTRTLRNARRPCPVRTEDRSRRPAYGSGERLTLDSAIDATHAMLAGDLLFSLVRSTAFFVPRFPSCKTSHKASCKTLRGDAHPCGVRGRLSPVFWMAWRFPKTCSIACVVGGSDLQAVPRTRIKRKL